MKKSALKNILLFTLYVMFFLGLVACHDKNGSSKDSIRPVKSMIIPDPRELVTRNFPGKTQASEEATLAFQVNGILKELPISEGMKVTKGSVLATLDPKKYQDTADEMQARYDQTKTEYERAGQLVEKNYVSRSDYDAKKALFEIAKANLSAAQHDLDDTVIKAPFDGTVAKTYVDNFQNVAAKQPVLLLQNLSYMDIKIDVPENVMINIVKSQESPTSSHQLTAIFDAYPQKSFSINYIEHSSEADKETQTFEVIFTLKNPSEINLLPGMTATVSAQLPNLQEGTTAFIIIPASAVFATAKGDSAVWIVDLKSHKLVLRKVKVAGLMGDKIQISQGIHPGERIVTAGVSFLQEGQEVSIMENQ